MRKAFVGYLIVVVMVQLLVANVASTEVPTVLRVVSVQREEGATSRSYGSGFCIVLNNKTYLITAAHVVDRPGHIEVSTNTESIYAKLGRKWVDIKQDVAVYEVLDVYPKIGVFTLSSNTGGCKELTVSGFPGEKDVVEGKGEVITHSYHVDYPIAAGMSGGPVLNSKGEVVGLIHGTIISEKGKTGEVRVINEEILLNMFKR